MYPSRPELTPNMVISDTPELTALLLWIVLERRSRLCGLRRERVPVGKASAHGCFRVRRWLRPCAWPKRALDLDEPCGHFWRRCTSWALISRRFLRL